MFRLMWLRRSFRGAVARRTQGILRCITSSKLVARACTKRHSDAPSPLATARLECDARFPGAVAVEKPQRLQAGTLSAKRCSPRLPPPAAASGHLSRPRGFSTTVDVHWLCLAPLVGRPDAGGASTQIIFRHDGGGHDGDGPQAGSAASRPATSTTIKDTKDAEDGDNSTGNTAGRGDVDVANDSVSAAELDTHEDDNEEGGEGGEGGDHSHLRDLPEQGRGLGGSSSAPVSQSDFWGASHLGYGVAEVSLWCNGSSLTTGYSHQRVHLDTW